MVFATLFSKQGQRAGIMAKSATSKTTTTGGNVASKLVKAKSIAKTSKAAAAKSAVSAQPKPVVVTEKTPVVSDPALKKKELIEIVTERSGIKKKDAKPVIEAMLAVLGQTLAEGREMNLQPLGKVRINRAKDVQGGKVLITKIRQSNRVPKPSADPAAKAAE
jgi:nucleoid DNA-binding protein